MDASELRYDAAMLQCCALATSQCSRVKLRCGKALAKLSYIACSTNTNITQTYANMLCSYEGLLSNMRRKAGVSAATRLLSPVKRGASSPLDTH